MARGARARATWGTRVFTVRTRPVRPTPEHNWPTSRRQRLHHGPFRVLLRHRGGKPLIGVGQPALGQANDLPQCTVSYPNGRPRPSGQILWCGEAAPRREDAIRAPGPRRNPPGRTQRPTAARPLPPGRPRHCGPPGRPRHCGPPPRTPHERITHSDVHFWPHPCYDRTRCNRIHY